MKLRKCLNITKCSKFSVFIYPKGHIKEHRGMGECPLEIIELERNEKGDLPNIKYGKCKVKEIIPHGDGTNIVIEID